MAESASARKLEVGPWPEACSSIPSPVTSTMFPTVGNGLTIFHTAAGLESNQVVVIVNGNGFGAGEYGPLAEHLAREGYLAAVAHRPESGDGGDAQYVLDVVGEVLDTIGVAEDDPDLRIGLVGHSVGGRLIIEAAALNLEAADSLPIRALMGLAPAAEEDTVLDSFGMPAYMSIYGTQDEDLAGFGPNVHEAFRAYDQVGSERSTTCNSPPCPVSTPAVDKTMVYVYGADHAGLIGDEEGPVSNNQGAPQHIEYISAVDQFCLTTAYTTAFFHWQLGGDAFYKGFIRDEWRPPAIRSMRTQKVDGFGNPANSPIRLFHQISPKWRRVIHDFESGHANPTHSQDVQILHGPAFTYGEAPLYDRHGSSGVFVGWSVSGSLRYVRWNVAPAAQQGSTFTHLSLRIGQLAGTLEEEPTHNAPGADLRVYLGISDAFGETDLLSMDLPSPDPYLDGAPRARTAMSTFRFPVDELNPEMDLDQVVGVWLIIANPHGSVLLDSIEWHRDH